MSTPHYLRFVQALALAAVLPGCDTAEDPAPTPAPLAATDPRPDAATDAATDAAPAVDAVAAADSGYPHASGPIVPPELPADFA